MCVNENKVLANFRQASSLRLSLWGLEERFHCSVIGTCLSLKELLKMGTKFKLRKEILESSFDLHGAFVTISAKCSPESRAINKYLNKKYLRMINKFSRASSAADLHVLWHEALDNGDITGAYWALLTHPKASTKLLYAVLGKVHMLSHLSGEMLAVDRLKLAGLQRKVASLQQKTKQQEQRCKKSIEKKDALIEKLNQQLIGHKKTENQLQESQQRLLQAEQHGASQRLSSSNDQLVKQLQNYQLKVGQAEREASEWKKLAETFSEHKQDLEERMGKLVTEQKTVEGMLQSFISPCQVGEKQELDLCNRCILLVGGRTRQSAHFRALVEKLNGRFLHHDGGLEESSQRLSALVSQSDAVLCPLDCISHDAMHRVKRDCKHQGKPLEFLRQSGLATFSQGLERLISEH